jgi:cyclopropane fatty-acyl-phospholipid synthase-like methyltransferase
MNHEIVDEYKDGSYLHKNQTWHVEDSAWKAKQVVAILEKNRIRPTTVCEVGCGAGEILKQLSVAMPDVSFVGYELSPQAFELCKSRESERVQFRSSNLLLEEACFDCLLCMDVFEHVEDYIGFLKALRSKATYKIFHIPLDISVLSILRGYMMAQRREVAHLHYFSPETALATLTHCGYEVVDSCFTTPFLDLPRRSLIGKCARPLYRMLYAAAPHWTVRLLGLSSYLVLAR